MISIILPTYNSIRFLTERMDSITNQSYKEWECIVIDGFSEDGTYEYLIKNFEKDSRFRFYQFPAKGVYDAWNKGIELAKGDYIYIATSDDTMDLNFLDIMLNGLVTNSNCQISHCCLTIIDENGKPDKQRSWDNYLFAKFNDDVVQKQHIRLAPIDGLTYAAMGTVYTSITQLLIKKNVFTEAGLFATDFNEIGDFEWGMRIGLLYNTLHVPQYLATWRTHNTQLTNRAQYHTIGYTQKIIQMRDTAFQNALAVKPELKHLKFRVFKNFYAQDLLGNIQALNCNLFEKLKYYLKFSFDYPIVFVSHFYQKLFNQEGKTDKMTAVKKIIATKGILTQAI